MLFYLLKLFWLASISHMLSMHVMLQMNESDEQPAQYSAGQAFASS